MPGVSLAIIKKSDSLFWAGGLGFADIENNIPMTDRSTMFIDVVSKNLTADFSKD